MPRDLKEWKKDIRESGIDYRELTSLGFIDEAVNRALAAEEKVQNLSAQVVAYMDAIRSIHRYIHPHKSPRYSEFIDDVCDKILHSPDPGAKYRAVVEAARERLESAHCRFCEYDSCPPCPEICKSGNLKQAFAALEGGPNEL